MVRQSVEGRGVYGFPKLQVRVELSSRRGLNISKDLFLLFCPRWERVREYIFCVVAMSLITYMYYNA